MYVLRGLRLVWRRLSMLAVRIRRLNRKYIALSATAGDFSAASEFALLPMRRPGLAEIQHAGATLILIAPAPKGIS